MGEESTMAGRFALAVTVMVLASAVHGMPATAKVAKLEPADDSNGYMPELVIEAPETELGESAKVGAPISTTPATLIKATVASATLEAIDETGATTGACGDGKRQGAEECDDGNTAANDGCSATCKVEGGYQCLPLEVNGKDMCVPCGDKQCTTSFSLQSRCMDTKASLQQNVPDMTVASSSGTEPASMQAGGAEPPVDEARRFLETNSFLQVMSGGATGGAYERASNGFCKCSPDYCKSPLTAPTFTCKFPNGICKKCPVVPGHCETECHDKTTTDVECVKFCRTKVIKKQMVRATAQGQM